MSGDYYYLMECLRLLKFTHDIGIYTDVTKDITSIDGDDYYELVLSSMEHVAPVFAREDLGEDVCCGGHTLYHFSDPAIPEYYRLCRLYEHGHSITPNENPYTKKADDYFSDGCKQTWGHFGAWFDDDIHVREIQFETCHEYESCELDLLKLAHKMMEFYRREVEVLRNELLRGPIVWLPALPAPTVGMARQPKSARRGRKSSRPARVATLPAPATGQKAS